MMRAIIVDAATGRIKRKVTSAPGMLGTQTEEGEIAFALINDDGAFIPDQHLVVSESGEWELAPGAPPTVTAPSSSFEYIAS